MSCMRTALMVLAVLLMHDLQPAAAAAAAPAPLLLLLLLLLCSAPLSHSQHATKDEFVPMSADAKSPGDDKSQRAECVQMWPRSSLDSSLELSFPDSSSDDEGLLLELRVPALFDTLQSAQQFNNPEAAEEQEVEEDLFL
ncbi:hypothetical protein FOA52_000224 [Chlamydomonas sp. UWO 241]|nr:hypothetical protein FOA52_000224 [Chlamydomonas sp. UWO 241]